MPEIVLEVLKYLFLALIFLFLARAVKAMYLEIYGLRSPRPAAQTAAKMQMPRSSKPPERLVVVDPAKGSNTFEIGEELMLGRSDKCQVVLSDAYASQVHARIFKKGDQIFIEDMGSTNGTYLNRRKVTQPLPVARGDKARIGKTEMEFRR